MQSLHVLDTSLAYPNPEPLDTSIANQWSTPFSPFSSPPTAESPLENLNIPRDYFQPTGHYPSVPAPLPVPIPVRVQDYNTYAPYYNYNQYNMNYNQSYPMQMYPFTSPSLTEMVGNPRMDTDSSPIDLPVDFCPRDVEIPPPHNSLSATRLRQKPRDGPRWGSPPCIKSEFFNLDSPADLEDNDNDVDRDRENKEVIGPRNEQLSLSCFREALGVMDHRNTPSTSSSSSSDIPFRVSHISLQSPETVGTIGLGLTTNKQEEVLKAAKSLFSKRTRTLYQWLCPDASKTKLKASVTAAWDTLSEPEKHFYISQVLGRFGLRESSLMVNPQLDGIKGLPAESIKHSMRASICKARAAIEDQEAVNALFESCDDAHSWTSFRRQKKLRTPRKSAPLEKEKRKKRKYVRRNPIVASAKRPKAKPKELPNPDEGEDCGGNADSAVRTPSEQLDNEEVESALHTDPENMAEVADDEEFWNNPLNPAELFPEINF